VVTILLAMDLIAAIARNSAQLPVIGKSKGFTADLLGWPRIKKMLTTGETQITRINNNAKE
jgi:hypothetical protein